jgi:two-component system, LytTR family, response regulator
MSRHAFLAVRWQDRYVIVAHQAIVRIEACSDRVRIHADRVYAHRETLAALCARLPAEAFVRVHRSHVVNVGAVREARSRAHGEYALQLCDGSAVVTGRHYRAEVEAALGLDAARRVA